MLIGSSEKKARKKRPVEAVELLSSTIEQRERESEKEIDATSNSQCLKGHPSVG
jgi:pyruvate kinase